MAKKPTPTYENFESFEQFFQQTEQRLGYWIELAKLDFTREVHDRMKVAGVSKTQLAEKLDSHPAFVTRLLSGRNNFELATMVRIAQALDCEFRSHLQPRGTKTCWIDVLKEEPQRPQAPEWNPKEFRTFKPKVLNYVPKPIAA